MVPGIKDFSFNEICDENYFMGSRYGGGSKASNTKINLTAINMKLWITN